MHSEGLFGDQDFLLLEFFQERQLELGDEPGTAVPPEVQHGHDHDLIRIQSARSLLNAAQRKLALRARQAAEAIDEASLHLIEDGVREMTVGVIGQGEIDIVAPGRSSHR
jgi:hypothetical protein